MKKVTNTTFGMIAENRRKAARSTVALQRLKKDGTWGKPLETERLRPSETDEQVLERITQNNPSSTYRLAE